MILVDFNSLGVPITRKEFSELASSVPSSFELAEVLFNRLANPDLSKQDELIELCRNKWFEICPDLLDIFGLWWRAMKEPDQPSEFLQSKHKFEHYKKHWKSFNDAFKRESQNRQKLIITKIVEEIDYYQDFICDYAETLVNQAKAGESILSEFKSLMKFWINNIHKQEEFIPEEINPTPYLMNMYAVTQWYSGKKESAEKRFKYVYQTYDNYYWANVNLAGCLFQDMKQGNSIHNSRINRLLTNALDLVKTKKKKMRYSDRMEILAYLIQFNKYIGDKTMVKRYTDSFNAIKRNISDYPYDINDFHFG